MNLDAKDILLREIKILSEKIRAIEDDCLESGIDFKCDLRYSYLVGKRDFAKFILNNI